MKKKVEKGFWCKLYFGGNFISLEGLLLNLGEISQRARSVPAWLQSMPVIDNDEKSWFETSKPTEQTAKNLKDTLRPRR